MGRLPFHHRFRFVALCASHHPWPLASLSFDPLPRPMHRSQLRCRSRTLAHVSDGRTGSFRALFRSIAYCRARIFHPRGHATWLVHVQVQPLPRRSPPLRFYFPFEPVPSSNRTRGFAQSIAPVLPNGLSRSSVSNGSNQDVPMAPIKRFQLDGFPPPSPSSSASRRRWRRAQRIAAAFLRPRLRCAPPNAVLERKCTRWRRLHAICRPCRRFRT